MRALLLAPVALIGLLPNDIVPPLPPQPPPGPDIRYEDLGRDCYIAANGSVTDPTPTTPANGRINALVRTTDNTLVGYACVGSPGPVVTTEPAEPGLALPDPQVDEGGWTTIWILGLCAMLLFLGGLSLDLWRAFGERRNVAAAADAAALAGANALDESRFRQGGGVHLDPSLARRLADQSMATQSDTSHLERWDIDATAEQVTVVAHARIPLGLVRILMAGQPLDVRVTSTARPRGSP
jgi:hypothetical protein